MASIAHRTVDQGTVYQREVYLDFTTLVGKDEKLQADIAKFLIAHLRGCPGKTASHKKSGAWQRWQDHKRERAAWDGKVIQNPTLKHPHPNEARRGGTYIKARRG